MLLVAAYSANLMASLTVIKQKLPFNTLKEFSEQDDYRMGTLSSTVWHRKFEVRARSSLIQI